MTDMNQLTKHTDLNTLSINDEYYLLSLDGGRSILDETNQGFLRCVYRGQAVSMGPFGPIQSDFYNFEIQRGQRSGTILQLHLLIDDIYAI